AKKFWKGWLFDNRFKILKLLSKRKQYDSAQISRFYIDYQDKSNADEYERKLKELWNKNDILINVIKLSRKGIEKDLFDNIKLKIYSIEYINDFYYNIK